MHHQQYLDMEKGMLALVDPRLQPTSLLAESATSLLDELDCGTSWLCSEKTDGTRCWLTLTSDGILCTHDRAQKRKVVMRKCIVPRWAPILLDGELVESEGKRRLVVFDAVCARGRDCRPLPLDQREKVYRQVCDGLNDVPNIPFPLIAKQWLAGNQWRELACTEGIIWQHCTNLRLVWKYKKINTIDLYWDGQQFPTAERLSLRVIDKPGHAGIYELAPVDGGGWGVVRERQDKTRENAERTIRDAVAAKGLDLNDL